MPVKLQVTPEQIRDYLIGEFGVNVKDRGLNIENLEVLEFLVRLEVQRRIDLGGVGASQ